MRELNANEMKEIKGGGITLGTGALLVMGGVFLIGFIDGLVRPLKCH